MWTGLSLYGATAGNLQWGITQYSGTYDSNYYQAILCMSKEEALSEAAKVLQAMFETARTHYGMRRAAARAAGKLGLPVPQDIQEKITEEDLKYRRDEVNMCAEKLALAKKQLAALEEPKVEVPNPKTAEVSNGD